MAKAYDRNSARGIPAADWLSLFRSADVETDSLESAKSTQGKSTIMGNFLARQANREVRIEVDGRTGRATLRSAKGRANQKLYKFEIEWDDPDAPPDDPTRSQPPGGSERPPAATRQGDETQSETATEHAVAAAELVEPREVPVTVVTGNDEAWE